MDRKVIVANFWQDAAQQNASSLQEYFTDDAVIRWHNTNELFTVDEYIRANCDYPGEWEGTVERLEDAGDTWISAVRVYSPDQSISVHAASFFRFSGNQIAELDEYWGDDGPPPSWRQAMQVGRKIRE